MELFFIKETTAFYTGVHPDHRNGRYLSQGAMVYVLQHEILFSEETNLKWRGNPQVLSKVKHGSTVGWVRSDKINLVDIPDKEE